MTENSLYTRVKVYYNERTQSSTSKGDGGAGLSLEETGVSSQYAVLGGVA